jgi:hypothetical protein
MLIVAAAPLLGAVPASAEVQYPYCIITGGREGGTHSCGYTSLAQCLATRVGTDMCVVNPLYQAAPRPNRGTRQRVSG